MTAKPLVSVLMTSYNRERYIGQAMESVLASTYEHFELLVVDDRSKDSTVAIAEKYAASDPRVKVFINEVNQGDYPNRNMAASHATGKYLKYVDADDYIYPRGLETLVEMMEQFPDAGFGLCSLPQDVTRPFPFQLDPRSAYQYHYQGPGLFHKAPLSAIIKKTAFDAIGGFARIRMAGDFEMWHRLGQRFPVVLMPEGIVWYREHGEQEMNHYGGYFATYIETTLRYLNDEKCPLDKPQTAQILRTEKDRLKKEMMKSMATLNFGRLKENFRKLQTYRHAG
ncbi:MAG TPA: glycosyltransferase family A protein [Puia sp.]